MIDLDRIEALANNAAQDWRESEHLPGHLEAQCPYCQGSDEYSSCEVCGGEGGVTVATFHSENDDDIDFAVEAGSPRMILELLKIVRSLQLQVASQVADLQSYVLPCDIKINQVTFGKGSSLQTLANIAEKWHTAARQLYAEKLEREDPEKLKELLAKESTGTNVMISETDYQEMIS